MNFAARNMVNIDRPFDSGVDRPIDPAFRGKKFILREMKYSDAVFLFREMQYGGA